MKISVFGTGYVGLVTGVCFAEMGNDVIGVDIDEAKIRQLQDGISPIYEPGLEPLLKDNLKAGRIVFTSNIEQAVRDSDILFVAVGTPSGDDGSADLSYVMKVAESIGKSLQSYRVIVNKSTVPVGTQKKVTEVIAEQLKKRGVTVPFDVVSNPEFLREGSAVEDCLKPHRVVVGVRTEAASVVMRRLYEPFLKSGHPLLMMDPESSEMTKYAANAMLATKISLMNEFSRVCEQVGADIENVRRGIGSDPRIGPHFIFAGIGYGGSCFPKDVKALVFTGNQAGQDMRILKAVEEVNSKQREHFISRVLQEARAGKGTPAVVALWGVAFKPGTDDIREAPAVDLIRALIAEGIQVRAYDPVAQANTLRELGSPQGLNFFGDQYEAIQQSDLLVICTEWKSFKEPNFEKMRSSLRLKLVIDGRNLYQPDYVREEGLKYISVGRQSHC